MVERQWTEEELITLQTMHFQGESITAIANTLDINWHTVDRKIKLLKPQARASTRARKARSSARPLPPHGLQKKSLRDTSSMGTWSLLTILLSLMILNGAIITVGISGRD